MTTQRWHRWRALLAGMIGTALLATFAGATTAQAGTNVVPDVAFRRCLNDAIKGSPGTGGITKEALASFVAEDPADEIFCWSVLYGTITSIQGAQYLTGITGIAFDENRISDLSPLVSLTGLRDLYLWGNRNTRFSQLSSLTQLSSLGLGATGISNLAPIAGLTHLEWLDLSSNDLSNLTVLAGLTNLSGLSLDANAVTDLRPLRKLTNLTELSLANFFNCPGEENSCYGIDDTPQWRQNGRNAPKDLSPLSSLAKLTKLSLSGTRISSVSALAGLTNLTELDLSTNRISDVSPLADLVKLKVLRLNGNRISSVTPLSAMTDLATLNLSANRLTDISSLPLVGTWPGGECDHHDQEANWGCIAAAYGQAAQLLVAEPGTYPTPVAGRAGLTDPVVLTASSGPVSVDASAGTVTFAEPGQAVLEFGDDADWPSFSGKITVHVLPAELLLAGSAKLGGTLTVPGIPSAFSGSCQWLRNGDLIPGATSCSHEVADLDVGASIAARITVSKGTNVDYKVTGAVIPAAADFARTGKASISGSARVGDTLTAKAGTWSPRADSFAYQWYRDGTAIPGAVDATYVPAASDLGGLISVTVQGQKIGYNARTRTSKAVKVRPGVLAKGKPSLSGTLEFGATLTVDPGTWGPAPVMLAYQWFRGRSPIPEATAKTYTTVAADIGTKLTAKVTATKAGYATATATATTRAAVKPLTLTTPAAPAITGDPLLGNLVTVGTAGWGPAPVTLACAWLRGGRVVAGANACTYTLTSADAGKPVTARVTGSKVGYRTAVVTSASTVRIGAVIAGGVAVVGTPKVGSTVEVAATGWGPSGATLSYQWRRDGAAIALATGNSYLLTGADKGRRISVTVTVTKPGYTPVSVTSARTARVAAA